MPKLYLVDGMSLVFRAYYAMEKSQLSNKKGEPTGAIFGFANIITSLLEKEKPENIAVVFDCQAPTFRHEIYDQYKANRKKFPEDLALQMPHIKRFLDLIGLRRIEKAGFEADDIIGTLAKKNAVNNVQVYCYTADKDFFQILQENIFLMRSSKNTNEFELIASENVKGKFGVLSSQVIDYLALIGDSSDNVPGVKGIGEKSAIPLIEEFGSLENIYENIDKIAKPAIKNKLIENKKMAFLSKELVTINTDVEISELNAAFEMLKLNQPDFSELDKMFAELGFKQLREKWLKRKMNNYSLISEPADLLQPNSSNDSKSNISSIPHNYIAVTQKNIDMLLAHIGDSSILSICIETDSTDRNSSNITGIALARNKHEAYYIPIAPEPQEHSLFASNDAQDTDSLLLEHILCNLKEVLENPAVMKCGYDIKKDAYILKRYGINLSPITFDPMVADYILNPDNSHDFQAITDKYLNYTPISLSSITGIEKGSNKDKMNILPEKSSDFYSETADISLQLCDAMNGKLAESNAAYLASNIEFPLIEVLVDMEVTGIYIDTDKFKIISEQLNTTIADLTKTIYYESGEVFNIDSPKQLGEVLFDKLKLPAYKKTKTGYSTDVQVLSKLAEEYKIVDSVLKYRQYMKLKTAYIDTMPKLINHATKRIHTNFNQTVASTGRLSSSEPNLQNIPIKNNIGKEIRRAIIPQNPDDFLLSADYSQIELRIMAYLSNDENLINAFQNNADIHSATAAILFDVPYNLVSYDMRHTAKTVNFGIMYGLGAYGLSQRLNMPRNVAQDVINNYFDRFPKIKNYIANTVNEVRQTGYSQTVTGRKRYFPDINSSNQHVRAAVERAAVNMPVQGTASDLIKLSMINTYRTMKERNLQSKIISQIHDELLLEVKAEELDTIADIVNTNMAYVMPLGDVPLAVRIGFGKNWLEAQQES